MTPITIYHNPNCSNSCAALSLIREAGITPTVIEYLTTPLSVEELKKLATSMHVPVRDLFRTKENLYRELGLDNSALSDDALLNALHAHPMLLNRPIVCSPLGTKLCRPPETVLSLLPS